MKQTEREYAEALFMLAEEENSTAEYAEMLKTVVSCANEDPLYLEFLSSPAIPLAERISAIDEAFGQLDENILSFLKLLCENGHIRSLPLCAEEFYSLLKLKQNTVTAGICSVIELTDKQKSALIKKLSSMTGKTVEPFYTIDPSLIGGIKINIEGKTYDGSLKHRLHDIKDVITG